MKRKIVVQIIVIIGILSAAAGIYFHNFGRSRVVTEKERFERVLKADRKVLNDNTSTDAHVYSALVRLGAVLDPLARSEAINRAKSESYLVRSGAANALGYFEDKQSLEVIEALLNDRVPAVRIQAITGLGHLNTPARGEQLLQILKRNGLTEGEREAALSTLILVGHSKETQQRAVQELVSVARKQLTEKGRAAKAVQVLAVAPRNPLVLKLLEEFLKAGNTPQLEASGIRHLAAVGSPWLKANINQFSQSQNMETRLAVIQSLHAVCPANRFEILQREIEQTSDVNIMSAAFDELGYLMGASSIHLLEKLERSKRLSPRLLVRLKTVLREQTRVLSSATPGVRDLCALKSK